MLPRRKKNEADINRADAQVKRRSAPPTLRLSCNDSEVQEISLDRPRLLIGRAEENDISIPCRYASRHHILLVHNNGSTILIDLESTNGTYVNSERVYNHVLADGDVITIDEHSLFVHYDITYRDPDATNRNARDGGESAARAINRALAEVRGLLAKGDTDFLPTLREEQATVVGIIDDR